MDIATDIEADTQVVDDAPEVSGKPKARRQAAAPAQAEPNPAPDKPKRKLWRTALMLIVPLILAAVGGYVWLTSGRYVSTDNAYVQADKISISAQVSGPIVEVAVRENQRVEKGDLLFRLDPRPYRLALASAQADIAAARVQVGELQTKFSGTGADIGAAQENVRFAERALARQAELLAAGFTTRARHDEAMHVVQEARQRLANAQSDAANARASLATGGATAQPAIAEAMAARDKALLNLALTEVRAPAAGIVSQTERLQVGQTVVTGLPVVSLVRGGDVWIEANFKETDLAHMQLGQPASVRFDAYPDEALAAHIASIGAGTGSQFSVLPAQNANGNWVKVTQRVPVRFALDAVSRRPLIAGLSAKVKVDVQSPPKPAAAPAGAPTSATAAAPR